MYINELLDAYKKSQNYVQDKQIAHDLNLQPSMISKMRKGSRYVSDSEAVFLAENAGIDPELALLGCHADRNENPQIKQLWEHMAKKFDGLGLSRISMACGSLTLWMLQAKEQITNCVLCPIMLSETNHIACQVVYKPFYNERVIYAPPKDDKELHFS